MSALYVLTGERFTCRVSVMHAFGREALRCRRNGNKRAVVTPLVYLVSLDAWQLMRGVPV